MAGLAAEGAEHETPMIASTDLKVHRTASNLRVKTGAFWPDPARV